jgi:hypothetical protein
MEEPRNWQAKLCVKIGLLEGASSIGRELARVTVEFNLGTRSQAINKSTEYRWCTGPELSVMKTGISTEP